MLVNVGPVAQVPTDRCITIANGTAVVVRVGDDVVAFPNRCLHQASPLGGGLVFDGKLTCPLHFWRYHLPSGEHVGGEGALERYPVQTVDGVAIVVVPDPTPQRSIRDVMLDHARTWVRDEGGEI